MSRSGVAAIAVAVLMIALASSSPAKARRHIGFNPFAGLASAFTHPFGMGLRHHRHVHHRRERVRPNESATIAPVAPRVPVAPAAPQNPPPKAVELFGEERLDVGALFTDPSARQKTIATAALAHWHDDRNAANGWWAHGHGGYGWVGPLFWPFASDDLFGYAVFADAMGFWDYGYPDLHAAIFAPYRNDEVMAYLAPPGASDRRQPRVPPLQQLCGEVDRDIAGLAMGRIERAIQPTEAQRAALDRLADASSSAAKNIQASCSMQLAPVAPARLAVMQQRIAAILKAVISLESPWQALYDSLNDAQKARLDALADDHVKVTPATAGIKALYDGCEASQPAALQWPAGEIETGLHPNKAQREALGRLARANDQAVAILSYECRPTDAITPSDRLAAMDRRLDALQQATNLVSAALAEFYDTLDDQQKSSLELIGPARAP